MNETVIVHHPIPDELLLTLEDAGYQRTAGTDAWSTFKYGKANSIMDLGLTAPSSSPNE